MPKNDKNNKNNGRNQGSNQGSNQGNKNDDFEQGSSGRKGASSASSSGSSRTSGSSEGLPLDDLTYDVIALLHEKSKGLEVYEQFLEDAEENEEIRAIFEEIYEQDQQAVQRLEGVLRTLISEGASSEEEAA